MPDSSVTVRKMLSRGRNVMQWCSDSEAGKEISQTRVKLHSVEWIPGLLDGVERDCRLALLQGGLPSFEGAISFFVLLKKNKSLSPSLLENTDCYFRLAWGRDWGLSVSVLLWRGQAACVNLPQGPSQFLVLSAIPGGQFRALVALGQFPCLGAGQAAFSRGCVLLARKYSRSCSCQLVYGDSKAKAC